MRVPLAVPFVRLAIILAAAALLVAPGTQALPGAAVEPAADPALYIHPMVGRDLPMNTQPLPAGMGPDADSLSFPVTSACIEDPAGSQQLTNQARHTWRAGFVDAWVEYDFVEDGHPRIMWNTLTLHDDIRFRADPALQVTLRVQTAEGQPSQTPVVLPNVVVAATLREGLGIAASFDDIDTGAIIAQGVTAPAHLAQDATESKSVTYERHDGMDLYTFQIPMPRMTETVAADTGLELRIDAYIEEPFCQEGYIMPDHVRLHLSSKHPARLDMPIEGPLRADRFDIQTNGSTIRIDAGVASPWGSDDIYRGGDFWQDANITITGPGDLEWNTTTGSTYHCHCQPDPANGALTIDTTDAVPGSYEVRWRIVDQQGNAVAFAMEISVPDGAACVTDGTQRICHRDATKEKATPSVGIMTVTALVAVACLRRRA